MPGSFGWKKDKHGGLSLHDFPEQFVGTDPCVCPSTKQCPVVSAGKRINTGVYPYKTSPIYD
jgi:hypothetical protein